MKIKVKTEYLSGNSCQTEDIDNSKVFIIKQFKQGDWFDIMLSDDFKAGEAYADTLKQSLGIKRRKVNFEYHEINLGLAMQLPKGYEAIIAPRSSTFKKYGLIAANSIGVIDNSYRGETDYWKFPVIAFNNCFIPKGVRLVQFRIQLSQKATFIQKLKWLFSHKITFEYVPYFNDTVKAAVRGGLGSTGD